jgi:HSP20 family protein
MNLLAKWDPFRELEDVHNRLTHLLGRPESRLLGRGETESTPLMEWNPEVDIKEDEKEYVIQADLPGMKREDIKVTVEHGAISITGERKSEKEEKGKKFHRIERSYGSFERTFTLPEGTDAKKLKAEFKDGVLHVHLPKTEEAAKKTLEIKVE